MLSKSPAVIGAMTPVLIVSRSPGCAHHYSQSTERGGRAARSAANRRPERLRRHAVCDQPFFVSQMHPDTTHTKLRTLPWPPPR